MSKLSDIFDLPTLDSADGRRQRLLHLLLAITAGIAAVIFVLLLIVPVKWIGSQVELIILRRNTIFLLLMNGAIYLIGRYFSPKGARWLFVLLLIALPGVSDAPAKVVDGRSLIAFAVPILAASALLQPGASFVAAALSSLTVTLIGALVVRQTLPNIPGMFVFFVLALLAYLAARSLQRTTRRLRRSNAALRESEEHYRSLVEASPDAITLTDLGGEILMCNQRAAILHGFERVEQTLGRDAMAFFAPEERPQVEEQMEETAQKGTVRRREYTLMTKDGRRFPGELSTSVIRNAQGEPVAFMGITRDITERKRAEEALRESEERYRTLFETMAQGVVYQDSEGRIISANPAAESILGLSLDQMQGRTSRDSRWHAVREDGSPFPGDEHPATVALRTGAEVGDVVMGIFHPRDKEYRWINIHAVPQFRPGEEKPYQVYTTFEDITERKRAEEALRKSEARFRRAVLQSPFPAMLHAEDGAVILVNEVWTEITGYTVDDIPTIAAWTEKAYGDKQTLVKADIDRLYNLDRTTEEGEYVVNTKQGEERTWDFSSTPLGRLPDGRRLVLSMAADVTERKERARQLRLTEQSIEHAAYAVFWIEPDGSFFRVNETACQALGYARSELLRMGVHDVDPSYPRRERAERWEQIKNNSNLTIETKHKTKGGHLFPVEVSSHLVTFEDEEYEVAMAHDITERKRAEEELRQHREHLEEMVEERTAELQRLVDLMVGREVRMAELKEVIEKLRAQLEREGLEPVANDPLLSEDS